MENSQIQQRLALFLPVYNGQNFLPKQLDSIIKQTFKQWHLYVIDDGSTDESYAILQEYQQRIGVEKMTIIKSINQGCTKAILTLLGDVRIQADYYAYCDQDDIWDPDKLEIAIDSLEKLNTLQPLLYSCSARLIDEQDKEIGKLPIRTKAYNFKHALVENTVPGYCMVFNQAACAILRKAGMVNVATPDWWTYLVIAACGQVFYDPNPRISYRQHSNNLIGFDSSLKRRYKALKNLVDGKYQNTIKHNLKALHKIYADLTPASKETLGYFEKSMQGNLFYRLSNLHKSGVYRQNRVGTIALYIACIFGKL